jgi:4-amino-4-deoxy-L-arabinose transferase
MKSVGLLIGIFLFLYIIPLGVRPLIAPDETRYAEISREMIASGDWIVPRLDGVRYFEKPVLGYWLNAGAIRLFGENGFAARLPSALSVGFAALLLGFWARRFTAHRMAGPLTVAVFLLSFEVFVLGVFCVLDSLFSCFVMGSILFFYLAYESRSRWALIVSGVFCGLAFLTKGPLGVVLPAIVLLPFVLWEHRFRTTLKIIWLPCVSALLVALPWCVAIHRREPDFWHYFFWVEHIERFLKPRPGQHAQAVWYYVPVLLAGAMPWTPLAGTIIQGLRHIGLRNPRVRLALCWLIVPFAFFTLSSGKLGTYILVCFPPLAFLIAIGLLQCLEDRDNKGFVIGATLVAAGIGILLVLLIAGLVTRVPAALFETPARAWPLGAIGLLTWSALAGLAVRRRRVQERLTLYWLAPVLFMFSWHFIVGSTASPEKVPGAFLMAHADCGADPNCTIVCDDGMAASACWFYRRADVFIMNGVGEYEYGLRYRDSGGRFLPLHRFQAMIAPDSRRKCVALIMTLKHLRDFKSELPPPVARSVVGDLVLLRFAPDGAPGK